MEFSPGVGDSSGHSGAHPSTKRWYLGHGHCSLANGHQWYLFVYPWFRAWYPIENVQLSFWHTFGMEWKRHVAWFAPMLATAVAYVVVRYGSSLAHEDKIRRALIVPFTLAFGAAGVAGIFGAFFTKVAPIR